MMEDLLPHRHRIVQHRTVLLPDVHWDGSHRKVEYLREGNDESWLRNVGRRDELGADPPALR
jgi:hypothetical protein